MAAPGGGTRLQWEVPVSQSWKISVSSLKPGGRGRNAQFPVSRSRQEDPERKRSTSLRPCASARTKLFAGAHGMGRVSRGGAEKTGLQVTAGPKASSAPTGRPTTARGNAPGTRERARIHPSPLWLGGFVAFPVPLIAGKTGSTKPRSLKAAKGKHVGARAAMPASAFEAFLGHASEERDGYCRKELKKPQKVGNTSYEPGQRQLLNRSLLTSTATIGGLGTGILGTGSSSTTAS
jgi:hypothetical protein